MSAALYQRAVAAYEGGAWAEAEQLCRQILQSNPNNTSTLMVLALTRSGQGDHREGEAILRRALALEPRNHFLLNALANVLAAQGAHAEARQALETALQHAPDFWPALQTLGDVLMAQGDLHAARPVLERAHAAMPGSADPLAALAALAEKEERDEDCAQLAARALAIAPDHAPAHLTLARLRLRQRAHDALVRALAPVLDVMPPASKLQGLGYLGQALEKLARYDEAFAAFAAAKQLQADMGEARFAAAPGPTSRETIARMTAFVRQTDARSWRPAPKAARSPAFLVGFPRSGTTLLEQALASHPGIEALEEQNTLDDAVAALVLPDGALARWAELSDGEIESLRTAYWRRVETYHGHAPTRPVFIDKQPLAMVLLPLIYRLFPDAKILFALRDPRDTVLSCFQQEFISALQDFLTLDGIAAYYDAAMTLAETSRAHLPLAVHEVRYPDLVSDFRGTMEATLAFLGLPWDDAVMDHVDTAKARHINTPSAAQVRQPIYNSSLERWRHYQPQLHPVLPVLAPWIAKFGFAPDV